MAQPSIDIFGGMKITNYYKYILYLAGVVFILSLFIPVQEVSQTSVRIKSLLVVVAGLLIWFINTIMMRFWKTLKEKDRVNVTIVFYVFSFFTWVFTLKLVLM